MRNIPSRAWILALLSSGLQILVFPKINFYVLSWIAMVPLLYALLRGRGGEGELFDSEGRSLRPFTLWQGFLIGVGSTASSGIWERDYWIYPVMTGYGGLHWLLAAPDTMAAAFGMGLHHGLLCIAGGADGTTLQRRAIAGPC